MKRRTKLVVIFVPFIVSAIVLFTVTKAAAPYKYAENCYNENQAEFEELSEKMRDLLDGENTSVSIKTDESSDSDPMVIRIREILNDLNAQYQKDSEYYVFSYVSGYSDNSDRIMMYMTAKREKMNGDGVNTHDRRNYYLLYMDKGYDGYMVFPMVDPDHKPFSGNWYVYSSDSYSG